MTHPPTALSPDLLERVLAKLGMHEQPGIDLTGLNSVYAAISGNVSNDNVQKRIWLSGDRASPVSGGDPAEFFENWLTHGTGGTCFPINGAFAALLELLEFPVRRIASTMMVPGAERGCGFRAKWARHSEACGPPIPIEVGHRFRGMWARDSEEEVLSFRHVGHPWGMSEGGAG